MFNHLHALDKPEFFVANCRFYMECCITVIPSFGVVCLCSCSVGSSLLLCSPAFSVELIGFINKLRSGPSFLILWKGFTLEWDTPLKKFFWDFPLKI